MHSIPTGTGGRATASLTLKVNNDFAGPGCPPVLKQKDALVLAQQHFAVIHRNSKMALRQRALDMRRHVIGALGVMPI